MLKYDRTEIFKAAQALKEAKTMDEMCRIVNHLFNSFSGCKVAENFYKQAANVYERSRVQNQEWRTLEMQTLASRLEEIANSGKTGDECVTLLPNCLAARMTRAQRDEEVPRVLQEMANKHYSTVAQTPRPATKKETTVNFASHGLKLNY